MALGRAAQHRVVRCVCSVALLFSATASTKPKLQAIGEASLGYTDNVRTTPDAPGLATTPRSTAAFLTLSPNLVLSLEAPRATQRLRYRYEYDLFFAQSNTSISTNQLDYQAFFELSQRVTLTVGSSASETNRYAAVALSAPGSGVVSALPAGAGAYLQAAANEALSIDAGVGWRAWQGGGVVVAAPILGTQAPQTTDVSARTGLEKSFFRDAAGLEARSEYTVVQDGVRGDGTPLGVQELLVVGAVALWRHDWGRYLTSNAEGGALRIQRVNVGRGFWAPTASATLAYATEHGDAQLSYAHDVRSNALLGQALLVDEVRLRGALPLTSHDELLLAASAGYQRGSLIDENAVLAARVDVAMVDVALGWQATRALQLALRYQHIEQMSDARTPPLPLSFAQNNVLFGATLRLPSDRELPRPYRAPRRVDRSDELRDGVAPGELQRQSAVPSNAR